jgi:hypothetical protein
MFSGLHLIVLQNSFVSPNTDFPGRGCRRRILMWGTTSFCDELTDDFGGAFEVTPIDDCRLFCRLAEILPHSVLGLLQHNRPQAAGKRLAATLLMLA